MHFVDSKSHIYIYLSKNTKSLVCISKLTCLNTIWMLFGTFHSLRNLVKCFIIRSVTMSESEWHYQYWSKFFVNPLFIWILTKNPPLKGKFIKFQSFLIQHLTNLPHHPVLQTALTSPLYAVCLCLRIWKSTYLFINMGFWRIFIKMQFITLTLIFSSKPFQSLYSWLYVR